MAIAVQSSASSNVAAATSTTITKPSGVVSGDYLFAAIGYEVTSGQTINSVPSGWTLIEAHVNNAGLSTYYKVAGGSEPTSYQWGLSASAAVGGVILRIDGHSQDAGGALSTYLEAEVGNDDTPSFATGITPTYASSLILIATCSKSNGTTAHSAHAIATSNPTWTAVQGTSAGGTTVSVAYAVRPQTTSTGAWNLTAGNNGDATDSISQILSIAPRTDATVVLDVASLTVTLQAPTVTGGAAVTLDAASLTATAQSASATSSASKWVNTDKSSAGSITNTDKS